MEQEFRIVGKKYKKVAGKRFRIPRKVKKRFKISICEHGWIIKHAWIIKTIKLSYKRLNIDVVGHQNTKWAYLKDKLNEYETAYEKSKNK